MRLRLPLPAYIICAYVEQRFVGSGVFSCFVYFGRFCNNAQNRLSVWGGRAEELVSGQSFAVGGLSVFRDVAEYSVAFMDAFDAFADDYKFLRVPCLEGYFCGAASDEDAFYMAVCFRKIFQLFHDFSPKARFQQADSYRRIFTPSSPVASAV